MEDLSPESIAIGREIDSADLYLRAIEDIAKRLDDAKATDFTAGQQAQYQRLKERLFDLSK